MFCIRCWLCLLDYLDSLVGCFVDFKTVEVRTWLNSIYTISNDQRPHSKTSLLRRRLASSQHHVLIINTLVSWLWNNNFECRCDISMLNFIDGLFCLQSIWFCIHIANRLQLSCITRVSLKLRVWGWYRKKTSFFQSTFLNYSCFPTQRIHDSAMTSRFNWDIEIYWL